MIFFTSIQGFRIDNSRFHLIYIKIKHLQLFYKAFCYLFLLRAMIKDGTSVFISCSGNSRWVMEFKKGFEKFFYKGGYLHHKRPEPPQHTRFYHLAHLHRRGSFRCPPIYPTAVPITPLTLRKSSSIPQNKPWWSAKQMFL